MRKIAIVGGGQSGLQLVRALSITSLGRREMLTRFGIQV